MALAGAPAHASVHSAVPTPAMTTAVSSPRLAVPAAKKKPRAQAAATYAVLTSGKVSVLITSNAKKVQVKYRTTKNKSRTVTRKLKKGSVA